MENNELIKALYTEIKILPHNNKDINDTLLYALKLLHSLTLNINGSMYNILKNEVSSISLDKYIMFRLAFNYSL